VAPVPLDCGDGKTCRDLAVPICHSVMRDQQARGQDEACHEDFEWSVASHLCLIKQRERLSREAAIPSPEGEGGS